MKRIAHAPTEARSQENLKDDKKIVIAYYERHKADFKSKADAAYRTFEQKLVPYKYSTIYKWLDEYIRKGSALK